VESFFEEVKPDYVFLSAAKVGGIHANNAYPADFIYENLAIETNIILSAFRNEVRKLLFLGSSCIYPKLAAQPMKETCLLTGELEPTNAPYAVAKIAGIVMCQSFNRQYGTRFISGMPTNLYGPGDNFDLENSHVIPALIRKFHDAKVAGSPGVVVWGTGQARREFLHVDDLAEACVFLMEHYESDEVINIGSGEDLTIGELAVLVKEAVGYDGKVEYDPSRPDGTPRKLLDVSRIHALGWRHRIGLAEGLKDTYRWYLEAGNSVRKTVVSPDL
ncbi:MAG: GDP-L-fucose synthase family protein, partial [Thermodesulfobacteriota bacterium]